MEPPPTLRIQHPVSIKKKTAVPGRIMLIQGWGNPSILGKLGNVLCWRSVQRGHVTRPHPPHTHTPLHVLFSEHTISIKRDIKLCSIQPKGRRMTKMTSKSR